MSKKLLAVAVMAGLTIAPAAPAAAVVGGGEATESYPFMASVQMGSIEGGHEHYCGGALIAPQWVITAAHCEIREVWDVKPMVRLGSHDRDSGGEVVTISEVINHPHYKPTGPTPVGRTDDIALLKLEQPAASTPIAGLVVARDNRATMRVLGFGGTSATRQGTPPDEWGPQPHNLSDRLKELDVTPRPAADCPHVSFDRGRMMCLDNPDGQSAAPGDSGGPLLSKQHGKWNLAGLVLGAGTSGAAAGTKPWIATDLSRIRNQQWISDVTGIKVHERPALMVADPSGKWSATLKETAAEIAEFWTPARVAEVDQKGAQTGDPDPNEPEVPDDDNLTPGGDGQGFAKVTGTLAKGLKAKITGKLYFYDKWQHRTSSCSAAVVQSPSESLLLTAAHCVSLRIPVGGGSQLTYPYGKFRFVPGYQRTDSTDQYGQLKIGDAKTPSGVWYGVRAWVPPQWVNLPSTQGQRYDVGIVGIARNADEQTIQSVTGAIPGKPVTQSGGSIDNIEIMGYPGGKHHANKLMHCIGNATLAEDPSLSMATKNCLATGGNSGGPVFHNAASTTIVGVVSQGGVSTGGSTSLGRLAGATFTAIHEQGDSEMAGAVPPQATAKFHPVQQGNTSYQGKYDIQNDSAEPLKNWKLVFTLPAGATVTSMWQDVDHQISTENGRQVITVTAASWAPQDIAPDAAKTVEFSGAHGGAFTPVSCTLNGQPCSPAGSG